MMAHAGLGQASAAAGAAADGADYQPLQLAARRAERVGQREIARLWCVDERTVKREMARLRALGWVEVKQQGTRAASSSWG